MARVNTFGMEEILKNIRENYDSTGDRVVKMLDAAADEVVKITKTEAESHGLRRTGKLINSIKHGDVKRYSDSAEVEVWPHGTRKNGRKRERNATVGFVQHCGRQYKHTKRAGTLFFDASTSPGNAERINEIMADIWHEGE